LRDLAEHPESVINFDNNSAYSIEGLLIH
jgi:hypothetical protein